MGMALLEEARSTVQQAARLSPRSMGEINEMLVRIRPTVTSVDASYGSAVSFGEIGSQPAQPQSFLHKVNDTADNFPDGRAGNMQFVPFSPGQTDFDKTIDNIWSGSESGETPGALFNLIGVPPLNPQWDGFRFTIETFYVILASLAGALLFGVFMFMN